MNPDDSAELTRLAYLFFGPKMEVGDPTSPFGDGLPIPDGQSREPGSGRPCVPKQDTRERYRESSARSNLCRAAFLAAIGCSITALAKYPMKTQRYLDAEFSRDHNQPADLQTEVVAL
jgi:hypothetical protein